MLWWNSIAHNTRIFTTIHLFTIVNLSFKLKCLSNNHHYFLFKRHITHAAKDHDDFYVCGICIIFNICGGCMTILFPWKIFFCEGISKTDSIYICHTHHHTHTNEWCIWCTRYQILHMPPFINLSTLKTLRQCPSFCGNYSPTTLIYDRNI